MTTAWWAAFGPAEAQLSCGGGTHRLRWADGKLHAVDHPDAEGELVLAALGGEASPCLDLIMSWGRHGDDLTVLAIGPRSAEDRLTIKPTIVEELATSTSGVGWTSYSSGRAAAISRRTFRKPGAGAGTSSLSSFRARATPRPVPRSSPLLARGFARSGHHGPDDDPGRAELVRLLALGTAFQFRLSGSVAHAWSAGGPHADRQSRARPALTAALAGRLAPAAARWLDIDPGRVEARSYDRPGSADLERAGWGEISLTRSAGEPRLVASLPIGWLASVWAPGLALIGGHLIAGVLSAAWPDARVLALRSPGQDPVELSIRHNQRHWTVVA